MGNSAEGWSVPARPSGWRAHRARIITAAALVVTALAVMAVLLMRGTAEDPADAAEAQARQFVAAWEDSPAAAAKHTDDPGEAESLLESVERNLDATSRKVRVSGGALPADEVADAPTGAMTVPIELVFDFAELGEWRYDSEVLVVPADGADDKGGDESGWTVRWEPALVHPMLSDGQTLVYTLDRPARAPVLAADDSELAGPAIVWEISIWPAVLADPDHAYEVLDELDVDIDTEALAERVADADPDQKVPVVTLRETAYREHFDALQGVEGFQFLEDTRPLAHGARSVVGGVDPENGEGVSGLQSRYQEQLAGTSAAAVVIADRESGKALETLIEQEGVGPDGEPGAPVRTTIDPTVQQAAEEALVDMEQDASIVAVRPSTGHILAAADWPADGVDRSLSGQLAPGSTFKVVSTAALLEQGVAPDEAIGCPKYATVDGQRFHNQNKFELGPRTTLHEAFTASCNTAYIGSRDRFEDDTLRQTAEAFGIGGEWEVGAATFDGAVPVADGANDLAASLIGQARVQASPLVMASVAATVADGVFRQPVLVPDAVKEVHEAPTELSADTIGALRAMMRDTVTEGSASVLRQVAGGAHAKTGTAEFATGEDGELSTNAWMIGYLADRDLAFAVMLEDGGSGGSHAGPVAVALLEALPADWEAR